MVPFLDQCRAANDATNSEYGCAGLEHRESASDQPYKNLTCELGFVLPLTIILESRTYDIANQ